MGGSAFSLLPNPLYTPRMPLAVYQRVRSACHAALRELFICVATPIEGPGKKDHGDVDILVALDRRRIFASPADDANQRSPRDLMEAIKRLLGAEYSIVRPTGASANLAIRWPSDAGHPASADDESPIIEVHAGEHDESKEKFIQVDISICSDVDRLCWILFKHAHGDLWNLLGSTIRPYGLTVDEEALWLRIPEIEKFDRKQAKVLLTRDPVEILQFLGMKVEGFWAEPFESVDALFDYATTCRFFWVHDAPEDDAQGETGGSAGVIGGEHGRKKLKSNDRRRMNGRPVYRRWITEFIPELRAKGKFIRDGPNSSIHEVRATVRDEAFAYFHVEAECEERLKQWRLKRQAEEMKTLIKSLVPTTLDPQHRACLVSALKKIVMEDDQSFGIPTPSALRDANGFYNMEIAAKFVRDNWQQVAKTAWDLQKRRVQEVMLLKAGVMKGT